MSRRREALFIVARCLAVCVTCPATAASPTVPPSLRRPASLAVELQRAVALRKALVVMVSLHGCPYCKLVRESYLAPLSADGQPIVQLELTGSMPLLDLGGRRSTHAQAVRGLNVRIAPTVLFLGRGGTEAAARLAGVANPDFYGAYLQERVDAANRSLIG